MKDELIADGLDDAADYIENHGWCQGKMENENGEVCALGAVNMAFIRAPYSLTERAVRQLSIRLGADPASLVWLHPVAYWNDAPDRTKQEVLDLLRSTAKEFRR